VEVGQAKRPEAILFRGGGGTAKLVRVIHLRGSIGKPGQSPNSVELSHPNLRESWYHNNQCSAVMNVTAREDWTSKV
jgi:hypothetical protein